MENSVSQSVIQRSSYSLRVNDEPLQQTPRNTDIRELLQQLVEGQKEILTRLNKIEMNQTTLSQGQVTIVSNQEALANKLESLEASVATKPDMMAQATLLMECKVAIKRSQNSLFRITGETHDKCLDEVAAMFPLRTIAAVQEVEEKLCSAEFNHAMITYITKTKGISEEVSSVIRVIFTDDLLEKYNWDGRWEKLSLAKLNLVNKIVRDVFQKQGALEFDKNMRKAVERAHHRYNQKNYVGKTKQK